MMLKTVFHPRAIAKIALLLLAVSVAWTAVMTWLDASYLVSIIGGLLVGAASCTLGTFLWEPFDCEWTESPKE